jgi:DNA-binding MarR family transcriptional regulator
MKRDDMLKLDNQICFLLYASSRKMSSVYAPYLAKLGLTYPQYLVMLVLWEKENVEVGYIAEKLMLDTGTMSPLLKKMQASGFIGRSRGAEDERKVLIVLTDEGRRMKKQALDIPRSVFADSGFSMDEYSGIKKYLSAFLDRLR